ncbi:hypothetical protein HBHAL_4184 [Halobacillus halophilus DSM 2266]|uniref:Uncharacterized protein n=1 Tax=Halobacillus halophilus (strain ATCC 35676 / DSM 2266 / JCM 20832 / KCTC 3685 / LMG 17431 / NBRC 102448 / NCIMB 2269) TaxID=866895 RepID=I0JQV6_HALH3|nr:hypothetical protein HBHAL_4184 [Halobacillus halophilus DSM 2266]
MASSKRSGFVYLAITIISISFLILMLYGFRSSLFSSNPENLKVLIGVFVLLPLIILTILVAAFL